MFILIMGGAASGKSAHAERLLCEAADGDKLYLASMETYSQAAQQKIARHCALRNGKGFETIEQTHALEQISFPKFYDGILLEDVGNLVANELFFPDSAQCKTVEQILSEILYLQRYCNTLVTVTNSVFSDGLPYDDDTRQYIAVLGQLNTMLAVRADCVYESVCGVLCRLQ